MSGWPRILPSGPRAVLAEYGDLAAVMAATEALRAARLPGVVEVVPAARTVLVAFDGPRPHGLLDALRGPHRPVVHDGPLVRIGVRYDGADLSSVAQATGLTVGEVVSLHTTAEFVVAFCGFMPGFAYLIGLPSRLWLPRRPTPRPRVPAGSVAVAAEYTAVYPGDSPGGWHLLGTTAAVMWDDDRDPPSLLAPGMRVRFEAW